VTRERPFLRVATLVYGQQTQGVGFAAADEIRKRVRDATPVAEAA
jgi:hypothetical protein